MSHSIMVRKSGSFPCCNWNARMAGARMVRTDRNGAGIHLVVRGY
ncbi:MULTISPECIES: hypothetical protein [Paenibacillus]|nr:MULTISPECIES: hypothetical protein [Paenibacillus]